MLNKKNISLLIKIVIVLDILLFIGVLVFVNNYKGSDNSGKSNLAQGTVTSTPTPEPTSTPEPVVTEEPTPEPTSTPEPTPTPEADPAEVWANEQLAALSTDAKILQMYLITPEELTGVDVATVAGDTTHNCLKNTTVGGMIFYAMNIETEQQFTNMCVNYQKFSKEFLNLPILIAAGDGAGDATMLKNAGVNFNHKENTSVTVDNTLDYAADVPAATVEAVKNGGDVLLITRNFKTSLEAFKAAVANGTISEDRLNESVLKILKVKYALAN